MSAETPEQAAMRAMQSTIDAIDVQLAVVRGARARLAEIASDIDAIKAGTFEPAPEPDSGGF